MIVTRDAKGVVVSAISGRPDPLRAALSKLRADVTRNLHSQLDQWCRELGWNDCHWRNL